MKLFLKKIQLVKEAPTNLPDFFLIHQMTCLDYFKILAITASIFISRISQFAWMQLHIPCVPRGTPNPFLLHWFIKLAIFCFLNDARLCQECIHNSKQFSYFQPWTLKNASRTEWAIALDVLPLIELISKSFALIQEWNLKTKNKKKQKPWLWFWK